MTQKTLFDAGAAALEARIASLTSQVQELKAMVLANDHENARLVRRIRALEKGLEAAHLEGVPGR